MTVPKKVGFTVTLILQRLAQARLFNFEQTALVAHW